LRQGGQGPAAPGFRAACRDDAAMTDASPHERFRRRGAGEGCGRRRAGAERATLLPMGG
jgi:hypothetical protein